MASVHTFCSAAGIAAGRWPFRSRAFLVVVLFFGLLPPMLAQQTAPSPQSDTSKTRRLEEVQVLGQMVLTSKTELSTEATASPASVSLMGRDYIAKQVVTSYGDLLRPLAGINVSNYQLGGVGYGIQLRGYTTTEHARDITFVIDGAVQNQGSSIQTNGYVDLNMLIPENIRRLEVIRGPFSPFYGDHALGGVIAFETEDRLRSSVTVSGGSFGTARGLATVGFGGKNGRYGYVSVEGARTDAYRFNNQEKHLNGFAKYTFPILTGTASIRAQAYGSDFGSAGYLNQVRVDSGLVSRTSAINPTDGGTTRQQNVVFNYKSRDASDFVTATAYVQHHDFIRIRTGVVGGAQRKERDNRTWFGADLRRTKISTIGSVPVLYAVGLYFRADVINNTRFVSVAGQEITQNRDRQIRTYTPAAYAQLQVRPTERLKLTVSARYDQLFYDLATGAKDTEAPNKGSKPSVGVFSPKAGIAYRVARGVNAFFNAAQGFKAPSGYEENLFNPSLAVSKLTSYEVGIGGDNASGRLHGLASAYLSDQTGEIQADPLGNLINFGDTRRSGIELEGRVRPGERSGLSLFGNYTRVVAKIRNGGPDAIYVTNTPEYAGTLGFDYDFGADSQADNRVILSVYDQLVGTKNLNTAGTQKTSAFHRIAGKIAYTRRGWDGFRVFGEGSFYPGNGALNEVSFLSGGTLLTSPQAQITLRGGVKVSF